MSIIRDGFQSADLDVPVVLPTLNLDFANSQQLDQRITFSRGSVGTFVNKNGLIETAPANTPRFDYDPVTGECKGLLIEESRSNYFWGTQTGNGGSVTDGTVTGANGVTAKKFVPTFGNTSFPSIYSFTPYTFSVASGGTVDISFSGYFAAVADGLYVPDIVVEFNTGNTSNYIFAELLPNLSTGGIVSKALSGAVGFSELIAPQITLMPFGMYKVTWSIRYTQGATIRDIVKFYIQCRKKTSSSTATGTYYADGKNGFQFSCIQYEVGAFPTSYIPTTTSSVTRSAEIAEMTGTNFSSWYNQTEGTFFCDGTLPFTVNDSLTTIGTGRVLFGVSNGLNFSNSMYVTKTLTSLNLSFIVIKDNVGQLQGNTAITTMTSDEFKIASAFVDRNVYSSGYGGAVNKPIRPSAAIPTVNKLSLGKEPWTAGAGNPIIGCIRKFAYYPKALSPAQLQYLTQ